MNSMGYLVFRSGFLPKILGVLLIIGCFGWLAEFFVAFFLSNDGVKIVMFTGWGEALFPLWLLVKGVNTHQWEERVLASA